MQIKRINLKDVPSCDLDYTEMVLLKSLWAILDGSWKDYLMSEIWRLLSERFLTILLVIILTLVIR